VGLMVHGPMVRWSDGPKDMVLDMMFIVQNQIESLTFLLIRFLKEIIVISCHW